MLRLPWLVPAVALGVLFSVAVPGARAQSPAPPQTVSGTGFQFQVPAAWQTDQMTTTQRRGAEVVTDDAAVASPDGSLRGHMEIASGFGLTKDHLPDVLGAFLGIGQGGDAAGTAPIASLAGPDTVQVANADSGLSGAALYTDPSGASRVMAARIALRGDTSYMLILDVTKDFYQSDPSFAAIMNSLQLTTP